MVVTLADLFDLELFKEAQDVGFVSVQRHPEDHDLCIANYTHQCQFAQAWNDVTMTCRGLIFRESTGEVVARGFKKFFNYDEPSAPAFHLDTWVSAFDKLDGSLGIMYDFDGYQMQIATRGSFASEQAMQANKILSSNNYAWTNYRDWTMLFEIIYPENRIVVNYNGMEELVYLGEVHNRTGEFRFEPDNFSGPSAAPLWEGSFRGLLECPAREGQEGLVVHDRSGNMVKVKYEEYVRLHRIITHLNEKTVWEAMNGPRLEPVHELAKELDEEHRAWLYDVAMKLMGDYMYLAVYVQEVAARVDVKNKTRKEVALAIREEPKVIQSAIFRGLDNKSYVDVLWKSIKPQEVREGEFTDE